MSETKVNSAGQKVTTYYKENEREEEIKAQNAERVQQNKNKRGDQEGATPKIKRVIGEIQGMVNRKAPAKEVAEGGPERRPKTKDRSVPPQLRGMPAIMGNVGGMPSWLQQPAPPAAQGGRRRGKKAPAPKMMQMGTGLPDWYFAQPPGTTPRKKGGSRLPDWY